MSNVSKNLALVREKIKTACLKRPTGFSNREPRLVAVSKTKPKESIVEAYQCGQRHFGENYVQEIVEKAFDQEILTACPDIKWHFIGHLQKNKINKLLTIPNLFVIETVDSENLADALNRAAEKRCQETNKQLNIFVQVNTSGEDAKSGCMPEEVSKIVKYALDNCKNLKVMGLMTIGKYNNYQTESEINPDFKCLVDCAFSVCNDHKISIDEFEISMGMSGDFEHAVGGDVGDAFYGPQLYKVTKPYQVLLDGTICVAALKNKINIHEQFTKYLEGNVKLLTTQCIVNEVEKLGSSGSKALFVLKNFGQHCCNHAEKMVPAAQCIMDMVQKGNQSRYIIATQDRELQGKCRRLVGVPLMYFHLRVPTLEAPSDATQKVIQIMAKEQFQSVDGKEETVTKSNEENEPVKKKRKHKGGPNPLSCKKKKKQIQRNESAVFKENKKKKRKHCSRLVKKIRNEVLASISTG